ncbi:MAG: prepilin-type N-terminal cleavage/methylation domain-containing protein, partial [Patescibacteria group bacterium]|nr:prepilin-type N-terminal cleavage/methylation domain-containing protein [Patescibacteria group bacterium]
MPSRGFTLTELVVVIAIMALLTGVFLTQQRQFDSTTLLRSLAYSVALSVRQAQTYGVSVRAFSGVFSQAHGIHFSTGNLSEYYLFSDTSPLPNGDRARASDGSEDVETFKLAGQNFAIARFCATTVGGVERCSNDQITSLTIL